MSDMRDPEIAAGNTASIKESTDSQMPTSDLRTDASPRLDNRGAMNAPSLHHLNGTLTSGAIGPTPEDSPLGIVYPLALSIPTRPHTR